MATYCCADLHGRYDLFQMIKDFIQPEDTVYVLGDCGDRGKDGWKIIKEVYENPQFIYIMGNHEQMFIDAMNGDPALSFCNGGISTYYEWKYTDDEDKSWIKKLEGLPVEAGYINKNNQYIILCHAGYTPHNRQNLSKYDYIWDRSHFLDKWDEDYKDFFVIHGHTPIQLMRDYAGIEANANESVLWYCPDENGVNHKCDIDCGAYFTGRAVLLDLDTFEQHIFTANEEK